MRGLGWNRLVPRIEKHEARLVGSLCALHFLVICGFTLARVARDGLLLSKLPVQYLPYIYLGLAAGMALTSALFGRLTARVATHRALCWALGGTGATVLLVLVGLRLHDEAAAIAFYLWSGAYGPLLVSEFWSLANERVNPRQARRLFGLIGAGGILGGLAGGALASFAGALISPQGLLLCVAALHFGTVVLARRCGVRAEEAAPEPARGEAAEGQGVSSALRQPYVRLLVVLFLAGGLTSAVLDYAFKYALQRQAADAGQITTIVGAFYGLQSLLALVAQVGLAGWILSRFGARAASAVLPGGLLAGSVLTLAWPGFPLVMGTRLYEATLRVSMARTAWEFLFFPLPDELRRPAKRFIDGVVSRAAEAAGGLLILGLNLAFSGSIVQLAALTALLTAAWIGVEIAVSRRYAKEVSASLQRMLSSGRRRPVSLAEAGAAAELLQLLESADERPVLYAMELLQGVAPDALRERAAELLSHPSAAVRARALTLPALREKALGSAGAEPLEPGKDSGDRGGLLAASPALCGSDPALSRLATLFEDRDPRVRHNAYRSAGLGGERHYVPLLIEKLGSSADRREAREALALYGDRIVGTLGDWLIDTSLPVAVRREIPRVLSAIGTQDAAYSLLRGADLREDRAVVHEVLRALNRIRSRDQALPAAVGGGRHLRPEIDLYLRLLVQRTSVRSIPDGAARTLLMHVLGEWIDQSLELIFRRLALLYPTREVLLAHRGAASSNARLRAQSLEVLDTILSAEHKGLLLPLIEDAPAEEKERRAARLLGLGRPSVRRTLQELIESEEPCIEALEKQPAAVQRERDGGLPPQS